MPSRLPPCRGASAEARELGAGPRELARAFAFRSSRRAAAAERFQQKDARLREQQEAREKAEAGKKDKAIETQEKALKLAEEDSREAFKKTLDSYKEGKLPAVEAE